MLSTAALKQYVISKAFARIALAATCIILLYRIVGPTKEQLRWAHYLHEDTASDPVAEESLPSDVDWSKFAYCQYVTDEEYLCNSLMIFESLFRAGAKADLLMLYPDLWTIGERSNTGNLLAKAQDEYGVHLVPIKVQHLEGDYTWADGFTKLLAFNQTQYKRILSLDSDATVLQAMDELFLLPSAPVAVPRAYWIDNTLSSLLVLLEPSRFEFERILTAFQTRDSRQFDMDIVNELYKDDCLIIPHRDYALVTGEFGFMDHNRYLGNAEEIWDPDVILKAAKYVHFSDWPYPKPWIPAEAQMTYRQKPRCQHGEDGVPDCRNGEKWLWLYEDFRERRLRVCGPAF